MDRISPAEAAVAAEASKLLSGALVPGRDGKAAAPSSGAFGKAAMQQVEGIMEDVADGVMRLISVDDVGGDMEDDMDGTDADATRAGSVAGSGAEPILVVEYCTMWLNADLARLPELDFGDGKGLDRCGLGWRDGC